MINSYLIQVSKYQEIQKLQKLVEDYNINIQVLDKNAFSGALDHVWVEFTINKESFILFIDDECNDFGAQNPLLDLCLVLRELETYHEGEDILEWTKHKYLEAGNSKVLEYYKSLSKTYTEIEGILGKIDSHISSFDFEFNAGAAQELRRN